MNLLDTAIRDINAILGNPKEFGVLCHLVSADGAYTVDLYGLAVKHHTKVNDMGMVTNSAMAHVTFSEEAIANFVIDDKGNILTDESGNNLVVENTYPVRNSKGVVDLLRHKVSWKDSNGTLNVYTIRQTLPDESVGTILCMCDNKI